MKTTSLLAALACATLWPSTPAMAQTETEIIDLPWDLFRAVQFNSIRHGTTAWKADGVGRIQNTVMEDGVVDDTERYLLARLQQERFTLNLRTRREASTDRFSITVNGQLTDESRALLAAIDADALSDATTQRADENRVDFLLRRGKAGRDELTALVLSDEAARRDFSFAIGERLNRAYNEAGKSFDQRVSAAESVLQAERTVLWSLTGEDRTTWRQAVRDAVVIVWTSEPGMPLYHGEGWFDDDAKMVEEAKRRAEALGL